MVLLLLVLLTVVKLLLLLMVVVLLQQRSGRLELRHRNGIQPCDDVLLLLLLGSSSLLVLTTDTVHDTGTVVIFRCRARSLLRGLGGVGDGSGRSQTGMIRGHVAVVVARLLGVVNEVAPGPVRAEADAVERAAQLRLVLRVALQIAQLLHAVRKLALVAVLALTCLLVRSA